MAIGFNRDSRGSLLMTSALCGLLASMPAHAQTAPTETPAPAAATTLAAADDTQTANGLGDIIVTAQKQATNLQKTPIAISVLNADNLADRHVLSLEDLGDGSIPSLRVAPFFARKSALTVGIRGIGALGDANQPARDQGVGVYLDGVYLGRAQGLGAALYDVERIEVLKGPQGTLFGRNTEGGAISVVTKKPTGIFGMETTAGISNYGGYEAVTHVNLPSAGNISLKFDGLLQKRGGTIENPLAGQPDFNSYERRGAHVGVLWEPSDKFSAQYDFDTSYDATTPYFVQLFKKGTLPLAPILKLQPDRAEVAPVGVPMEPSVGKTSGVALNLAWKPTSDITVKSISSYRTLTQTQFDNAEEVLSVFAPNGQFSRYSQANFYQHQYSEELQLLGNFDRVTFVGGLFYFHEWVEDNAFTPNTMKFNADGTAATVLPAPVPVTPFPDRASIAKTDSLAAFGQVTWTPPVLDDILHVTVGGRYSHDKKTGELFRVNGFLPVVNGVSAALPLDVSAGRFDPLVNISINPTRDIMLYGRWATGYKSAGANSRSLTYRPFGPESVSTFEIGAKTEFFDHRVRLNLAAYTTDYKDVQIDFNAVIPGSNRGTLETTNTAGSGRVKGIEADLTIAPAKGLTLSASYAYVDIRLPEAPNPFVVGTPLTPVFPIFTPDQSASGSIDYAVPVGGVTVIAHLDANYAASQYTSSADPTKSDESFVVNGRLSFADIPLNDGGAKLQMSVWSRNLLNSSFKFYQSFNAPLGTYGIYNEPRTYGLQGTIKF